MDWFVIGGVSFILSAILSDQLLRGKNGAIFLLGAAMLLIGYFNG